MFHGLTASQSLPEDALERAKVGAVAWQERNDEFFEECLSSLMEEGGVPYDEAMRLQSNVFGDFKGKHQ